MSSLSVESRARWIFAAMLLLGAAAAFAWYGIASSRYAVYQIRTRDPVSGLIADSPVEFHGVEVGKVLHVDLVDRQSVGIVLQVKKDAPVTSGTFATITSRGLASKGFTGYVYVALEDDGSNPAPLQVAAGEPYPQLRIAPARSINMDTAIAQVNDNVQAMTRLLQTSLDEKTVADVKQSLHDMQTVTRSLAANSDRMNLIIANAERASSQLEPLLKSTTESARTLQTEVLPEAHEAARTLQTQVLPEAHEALANLERLSTSLKAATAKVERDPSVLVRGTGRRMPGPGESR